MTSRGARKTQSIAAQAAELSLAVPQVVAHRVTRMALAGPKLSPRDRKEFELMVKEKQRAFAEAYSAMAAQSIRAHQTLAASFMQSLWAPARGRKTSSTALAVQLQNAALGIVGKGLSPIHRKAVANAKRLARTKLR